MIEWSEQFEIGIPVIDGQHKRIVEYINQVEFLNTTEDSQQKTCELLNLLVDYTLSHFAFEEALMEEANYPELEEHQVTHQAFTDQIKTLYSRFKRGEDIAVTLADVLLNWLLEHIKEDDASYAGCVKEKLLGQDPSEHQHWIKRATAHYFKH